MYSLKSIFSEIWTLSTSVVMWIPLHSLRIAYLRLFCRHIGKNTVILRNVKVISPQNISIGDGTVINSNVLLDGRGGLVIGSHVDIAREVNIWSLGHDVNDDNHKTVGGSVRIDDYVWIASRSTILHGVKIERGAVIACGAVVTKDVKENTIVGGVPARFISHRYNKLVYKLNYFTFFC